MNKLSVGISLLCLGSLFACHQEEETLYSSSDFTPEHEFTSGIEGPATDGDGNIYVVNYDHQGTIGRVTPAGESQLFVELPEGSIGNGIRLNKDGDLLVADYTNHNVLLVDASSREISVYAHHGTMNQPNDLTTDENQNIYLSDPNWKASTGNIWRVDPTGKVSLLEENMGTTNGIEVSPDGKNLYVNESVQRKVWVYDLAPDGSVSNKRLLIEFPDFGMDGMRCDTAGNLFITRHGKGTVVMVSPDGEILQEITLKGEKPSNITFGGPDGKTCYVTLQDRGCLEKFRVEFPGRSFIGRTSD